MWPAAGFIPQAPQTGGLNSTDRCYLLPVSRTAGFLPLAEISEPKYFFLRKTFKAKQIYFCHNLEANSLCDVCYRLNYTTSKVLALHSQCTCGITWFVLAQLFSLISNLNLGKEKGARVQACMTWSLQHKDMWGLCVCACARLPTYCLSNNSGNWVRKMFPLYILSGKWVGTRWWMSRYLYWLAERLAHWSCSWTDPWRAGKDPPSLKVLNTPREEGPRKRTGSTPSGVLLHSCHQLFKVLSSHLLNSVHIRHLQEHDCHRS